jgi:hypothetical protein
VGADRHVQKQIERLNRAREEKERIRQATERGEKPRQQQ